MTSIQFKFTGTSSVGIGGFECSLDNGAFSSCSGPTILTNLAAGRHSFHVRAVDTLGNRDPTSASLTWTILTPAQAIQLLIQTVHEMGIGQGTETTLSALLYTAFFHLTTHNDPNGLATACIQITAFISLANADGQNGQLSLGHAAVYLH